MDQRKDQILKESGWLVIRLRNEDVSSDVDRLMIWLHEICVERIEEFKISG